MAAIWALRPIEAEAMGRGGDNNYNYGQRLRRARLGLRSATAPILTLFIVLTLVYLVRREL